MTNMMLLQMVIIHYKLLGKLSESSQLHLYSALHGPWCLLCLVRQVSLAEYILVLRIYSHLLQMMSFMMASTRPVSIPLGMRTNRWARFSNNFVP